MKSVLLFFISMKFMVFLVLFFAFSIATATIVEKFYGTQSVQLFFYGAKWFEIVQILLAINLIGNIYRFRLYRLKKLPIFIFHAGFLVVLIGAGLTRYFGVEGVMHIREGSSQNEILTNETVLQISATKASIRAQKDIKFSIPTINKNGFFETLEIDGKLIHIKYKDFIKTISSVDGVIIDSKAQNGLSSLIVEIELDKEKKEIELIGKEGSFKGLPKVVNIAGVDILLSWGAKPIIQPFSIYLKKFLAEKYPGSNNPSSYESQIILYDDTNGARMPYKINPNNPFEYNGYSYFQSSYDSDEKGTILRAIYDPGKLPTYFGYTLLCIGMLLSLFNPNGRFKELVKTKYILKAFILISFMPIFISTLHAAENNYIIDKNYAKNFKTILVQGADGRVKPLDTVSIRVLNKIYGSSSIFGIDHNQAIASMLFKPDYWQNKKIIQVNHPTVKKLLGIKESETHFAYSKLRNIEIKAAIDEAVKNAVKKSVALRDTFDREIIKIEDRLRVVSIIFSGEIMRVFPLANDPNNSWHSPQSALKNFSLDEKQVIQTILAKNFIGINKGLATEDWMLAHESINDIKRYQQKHGSNITPTNLKIEAEIIYNELDLFNRLVYVYLFIGIALLFLIFSKLIKYDFDISKSIKIAIILLMILFLIQAIGLLLRWYISGYAPWSNEYETMLYISWIIVFAGILFAKQSEFAIASTAILAGIVLFVAHLNWLDPQITTIIPILKSDWLIFHVSIITAGYGFLGLSAFLGFISLLLYVLIGFAKEEKTQKEIVLNINESTRINEMSMIVGLYFLTIGNFLGGIWANETWGRYWAWDPKEAWTLITILIYVAIIHLKFVPKLSSNFNFSILSLASFSSVIMTYFGVSYYLSGLHSFTTNEYLYVPLWIYYLIIFIAIISFLAYKNKKVFEKFQCYILKIKR